MCRQRRERGLEGGALQYAVRSEVAEDGRIKLADRQS